MSYERRRQVRAVLRRWARIDDELDGLRMQYKAIVDDIDAIGDLSAQNLDGMPHGTGAGRPVEQAAVKRITLRDRYKGRLDGLQQRIEALERLKNTVENALLWTSPEEELVIRLKYKGHIDHETTTASPMTYTEIAAKLNYTDRRIKQIEAAAVETIGEHI